MAGLDMMGLLYIVGWFGLQRGNKKKKTLHSLQWGIRIETVKKTSKEGGGYLDQKSNMGEREREISPLTLLWWWMKVLEQCRCSFDVGPPPPRHAHSHPICSKFSPVSLFFPFSFPPPPPPLLLPLASSRDTASLSAIDRASDRFLGAPKASSQKQQRTKKQKRVLRTQVRHSTTRKFLSVTVNRWKSNGW